MFQEDVTGKCRAAGRRGNPFSPQWNAAPIIDTSGRVHAGSIQEGPENLTGRHREMAGVHLLDRIIGDDYPDLGSDAEVLEFEKIPYAERIAATSTYEAIKLGAAHDPDAPALQFLPNADPADQPLVVSYRDF